MRTKPAETILIVGAGQAGGWVARSLREEGCSDRVILIGEETHAPYERPPLSKRALYGGERPLPVHILTSDDCARLDIELIPSARVTALDLAGRSAELSTGAALRFDRLVLTTGSTLKRLAIPGAGSALVYLRTFDDALELRRRLAGAPRVAVIGGGFIGLEVASSARRLGCAVTVLEAADRLLARAVIPEVSRIFEALAREAGVEVHFGCRLERIAAGREGARIIDGSGRQWDADVLIAGVGIRPATELAEAAGLSCSDGIVVDARGRTSDPGVYAAGDVTRQPAPDGAGLIRLESWQNAQNQALVVGKVLAGRTAAHTDVPWFWSDQLDVNFQSLGVPGRWDEVVVRGEPLRRDGSVFLLDAGRLAGVYAFNRPRDIIFARRLMAERALLDPARLRNDGERLLSAVLPPRTPS